MLDALREQLVEARAQAETVAARAQADAAQAQADALIRRELDLMIVFDTTGSMADELDTRAHSHQVQAAFDLATGFRARSPRYRVSTISARVEGSLPPELLRAWNAGEPDSGAASGYAVSALR